MGKLKPKYIEKRKEIKIRAQIEDTESRWIMGKINEDNSHFFEETGNIDNPLARLTLSVEGRSENLSQYEWYRMWGTEI